MPVPKFTKSGLPALLRDNPVGRKITESASPLTLKVTRGGGQWIVVRKVAGKVKTYTPKTADGTTIANAVNLWPPEEARRWALGVAGSLARGEAPQPERRPRGTSFAEVAEQHLARYAIAPTSKTRQPPRPTSVVDRRQGIRLCNETLGPTSVAALGAEDVQRLVAAHAGANAKRAFVAAIAVMDEAVRQGMAQHNPFRQAGVQRPARPESRDRVPSLDEIGRVERAAAELGVGGLIVRLVLRTGLRVQAAATLAWDEIDFENRAIALRPLPGRKIRRGVVLPLGEHAMALLRETPRAEGTDLIAPGRDRHGSPTIFRSWSRLYPRLRELSGVSDFRAHDVRRAVVSLVAEHYDGADILALDKLLAHAGGAGQLDSTAQIYQRASFRGRMREAIGQWDTLLTRAFADNVLELRRPPEAG